MLTKDDTWINKTDLLDDFASIPTAIEDEQLRGHVNNYLRKVLKKNPKKKDERDAARQTLLHFPKLIDYYIKHKEDDWDLAASISATKVRLSVQLYVDKFKGLVSALEQLTTFYQITGNTYDEALARAVPERRHRKQRWAQVLIRKRRAIAARRRLTDRVQTDVVRNAIRYQSRSERRSWSSRLQSISWCERQDHY